LTSFGDDVPICAAWETRPRYVHTSLIHIYILSVFLFIFMLYLYLYIVYVWYVWSRVVLGCVW
jgi:hypothetical protein